MSATLHVRFLLAAIAATLFFSAAAPARAQTPSANALAMAKEFVGIMGVARQFEGIPGQSESIVSRVILQGAGIYLSSNPGLINDLKDIVDILIAEYQPRSAEIPAEMVKLYATRFTEAELKDLLAFYKSPLGKKLISENDTIGQMTAKRTDEWVGKFRQEIAERFRAELKKRGKIQ
jgi:uncharacterized protein